MFGGKLCFLECDDQSSDSNCLEIGCNSCSEPVPKNNAIWKILGLIEWSLLHWFQGQIHHKNCTHIPTPLWTQFWHHFPTRPSPSSLISRLVSSYPYLSCAQIPIPRHSAFFGLPFPQTEEALPHIHIWISHSNFTEDSSLKVSSSPVLDLNVNSQKPNPKKNNHPQFPSSAKIFWWE